MEDGQTAWPCFRLKYCKCVHVSFHTFSLYVIYFHILILHLRKDRDIMLRLALDKAARSWDPDLMHSALFAACLGDPCERSSDIQSCARLIKEKLYDLQVVGWWSQSSNWNFKKCPDFEKKSLEHLE